MAPPSLTAVTVTNIAFAGKVALLLFTGALLTLGLGVPLALGQVQWGVGPVLGTQTGLAMAYREDQHSWQAIASRTSGDHFALEWDGHRFYRAPLLAPYNVELYSGFGLRGQVQRNDALDEEYHLVLPVGMQWRWRGMPLAVFAEQSALLGPLPYTRIFGRLQLGMRALF